ncbi:MULTISPECIES: YkvA family protein [Acidovorax]|uniref:YkvA family protein n=1 Tax=Acidovorax facilis TaxID=12917 RepID=A0ABV8DH36_9BURK|nr:MULTISPECIES: YkvA family protein [Acidovorax]KQB56683.1 hypothetical protein AE621_24840 [Acidovorax sp. SD340]MBO1011459.1 DUF1232 domain-containing protein [Acidovorax sp. SD340]MCO4245443.1 YkvA family protein [Acidovorax facilis]
MKIFETLRDWAKKLKRDGVTLWFVCKHPGTPWYAKALGVFVVAYALSPLDLIPDFIPVLGYVDDVLLLPGLIWLAIWLTPAQILAECRVRGDEWIALEGAKPRSWWGAAIILALWAAIAWMLGSWWLASRQG